MSSILLVSANILRDPYPVYPIGISYIKTYLDKELLGYEIDIFDFNLNTMEQFVSLLTEKKFKYVCVSMRNIDDMNSFSNNTYVSWYEEIVNAVRATDGDSKIVIGGAGYSIFPKMLFERFSPDYAIYGEGEHSLYELIRRLDTGENYDEVEGLVYRDERGLIKVNDRKNYSRSLSLKMDDGLHSYYWNNSGVLNIQTKRGCPHRCIYCSYPIIEGSRVRTLDITDVIDSIKELYYGKGINYVFFTDSVFNIDRSYNEELVGKIIESGVKIRWGAYFSPGDIKKEDWIMYQKSGLTHVEFGSDSFSDVQLKNYNKSFSFLDIERCSKDCYELGIFYAHFLILGGYGETESTLDETFENSKRIEHSVYFPYVGMRVYPNTSLCGIAVKEGIIKNEEELIESVYYVSKNIDISTLKERALKTGRKWIFPDDERNLVMDDLRTKKRVGPLWEYLRY